MHKIKIGHRAKFRARNKYFLQILFPVQAFFFLQDLTSGVLILIYSADAFVLVMACVDCARACS